MTEEKPAKKIGLLALIALVISSYLLVVGSSD